MKLVKLNYDSACTETKCVTVEKNSDFILAVKVDGSGDDISIENEDTCLIEMDNFEFENYAVYKLNLSESEEYIVNKGNRYLHLILKAIDASEIDVDYHYELSSEPEPEPEGYKLRFGKDWSLSCSIDGYERKEYLPLQEVECENIQTGFCRLVDLNGGNPPYYVTGGIQLTADTLALENYNVYKVTVKEWQSDNLCIKNKNTAQPMMLQANRDYMGFATIMFEREFQYMTPTQQWTILRGNIEMQLSSNISVNYF